MDNATTKPITGADAAALLSGRSPSNLSMMLDFITPPERPPAVSPIGSVKNRQTSATEGFPCFLSFCNKASNSFSNQLRRSSGSFCVKPTRSTCTYLLTTELPEEADADFLNQVLHRYFLVVPDTQIQILAAIPHWRFAQMGSLVIHGIHFTFQPRFSCLRMLSS